MPLLCFIYFTQFTDKNILSVRGERRRKEGKKQMLTLK